MQTISYLASIHGYFAERISVARYIFLSLFVQVRCPARGSPEPETNAGSRIEVRKRRHVGKEGPPPFLRHCSLSSPAGTPLRGDTDVRRTGKSAHQRLCHRGSHPSAHQHHHHIPGQHSRCPGRQQQTLRRK